MINSRYYVFIESQPVVTPAVFGWGELEMLWAQQNTKKIRKYRHRHTSSGWLRGLIFVWVVYITPFFFFLNWMISEMFWSLILQLQSSFLCFMAMWSEVNRNFSLSKSQRFEGWRREECWTWVCFYFENNHSNHPFFFSLLYHFNPRVMLLDSFLCVNCMKLDVDAVVFGRSHSQRAS